MGGNLYPSRTCTIGDLVQVHSAFPMWETALFWNLYHLSMGGVYIYPERGILLGRVGERAGGRDRLVQV